MDTRLPRTLLVGNGLNRTLRGSCSWDELMASICPDELGYDRLSNAPSPIVFEIISSRNNRAVGRRGSDSYLKTKKRVCERVSKLSIEDGCIHNRLTELKVDNIITTNYDLCLEMAFSGNERFDQAETKSRKYLFEPTSVINGINFYHAHGIVSRAESICLGYEHYCGYIQRMREMLLDSSTSVDSVSRLFRLVCEEERESYRWPELFFTSNIDILGFSLDFAEIDFWWLLSLRSAFFTGAMGVPLKRENRVRYFDLIKEGDGCSNQRVPESVATKSASLAGLSVEYEAIPLQGDEPCDYYRAYNQLIDKLKRGDDE